MTLSEHIKLKRKKNGLSQVELAERAGVGLRFVRDLEQGKQTLRMDKFTLPTTKHIWFAPMLRQLVPPCL